jgi:hypothetical protein
VWVDRVGVEGYLVVEVCQGGSVVGGGFPKALLLFRGELDVSSLSWRDLLLSCGLGQLLFVILFHEAVIVVVSSDCLGWFLSGLPLHIYQLVRGGESPEKWGDGLVGFQRGNGFRQVGFCLSCFNVVCHNDGGGPGDYVVFHMSELIVGSSTGLFGSDSVFKWVAVDFYDALLIFVEGNEEFVVVATGGVLAVLGEAVYGCSGVKATSEVCFGCAPEGHISRFSMFNLEFSGGVFGHAGGAVMFVTGEVLGLRDCVVAVAVGLISAGSTLDVGSCGFC